MKTKLSVLVIDDDEAVRETLCDNLRECGFDVREAADGEEGVRSIQKKDCPHVVITDIIMPQKEGIETIIEIKREYPDIKLIAISGGGRTKNIDFLELAKRLGADATLSKPINIDELEMIINKLAN